MLPATALNFAVKHYVDKQLFEEGAFDPGPMTDVSTAYAVRVSHYMFQIIAAMLMCMGFGVCLYTSLNWESFQDYSAVKASITSLCTFVVGFVLLLFSHVMKLQGLLNESFDENPDSHSWLLTIGRKLVHCIVGLLVPSGYEESVKKRETLETPLIDPQDYCADEAGQCPELTWDARLNMMRQVDISTQFDDKHLGEELRNKLVRLIFPPLNDDFHHLALERPPVRSASYSSFDSASTYSCKGLRSFSNGHFAPHTGMTREVSVDKTESEGRSQESSDLDDHSETTETSLHAPVMDASGDVDEELLNKGLQPTRHSPYLSSPKCKIEDPVLPPIQECDLSEGVRQTIVKKFDEGGFDSLASGDAGFEPLLSDTGSFDCTEDLPPRMHSAASTDTVRHLQQLREDEFSTQENVPALESETPEVVDECELQSSNGDRDLLENLDVEINAVSAADDRDLAADSPGLEASDGSTEETRCVDVLPADKSEPEIVPEMKP
jgi:hypothetical protein